MPRRRRPWKPPSKVAMALGKRIPKGWPIYKPTLRSYEWTRKKWAQLLNNTIYRF
jgi:hypothetical protein